MSQNDILSHDRVITSSGMNSLNGNSNYAPNSVQYHSGNYADKFAVMKREREHLVKVEEAKAQKIFDNFNKIKSDSFETAVIDHQSLADYFSSEKKQQHAIDADHNQQVHHSFKLLNGRPTSKQNRSSPGVLS